MGLGLSISKAVIESHGGTNGYRPNAPSRSIFEIELPLTFRDGGGEDAVRGAAVPAN